MPFSPWLLVASYLLAWVGVAVVVRAVTRASLTRLAERNKSEVTEVLAASLPRPVAIAVFLFAVGLGIRVLPLSERLTEVVRRFVPLGLGVLGIALVMRVIFRAIDAFGRTNPDLRSSAGIGRALTWVLGGIAMALFVSDALGISLAPALTALGLGSLAIALALQDTLSNFFAGLYLLADKPISPGDFVRVEGNEGFVEAMGWRTTQIRTLGNNLVVVPNATLSKAIITNYTRPTPRVLVEIRVDVAADADLAMVERVLGEEAALAASTPDVAAEPAPELRFAPGLDAGAYGFTLALHVEGHGRVPAVQHTLRRQLVARLQREKLPVKRAS